MKTRRRTQIVTALALTGTFLTGSVALADAQGWWSPGPKTVRVMLPEGQTNPAIANGVAMGGEVAVYQSSGLGPTALNPSAPEGTPSATPIPPSPKGPRASRSPRLKPSSSCATSRPTWKRRA